MSLNLLISTFVASGLDDSHGLFGSSHRSVRSLIFIREARGSLTARSAPSTASPPRTLPRALDEAARTLGHAAQNLPLSASRWVEVAQAARTIANGLQNREVSSCSLRDSKDPDEEVLDHADELRTALGRDTDAIASVGTLMAAALDAAPLEAKMELCRVVGNACFDHGKTTVIVSISSLGLALILPSVDENRKLVLDANIPLSISQLAESVTSSSSPTGQRRSLEIEELRMLRASVGALLNSSLKFGQSRCILHGRSREPPRAQYSETWMFDQILCGESSHAPRSSELCSLSSTTARSQVPRDRFISSELTLSENFLIELAGPTTTVTNGSV